MSTPTPSTVLIAVTGSQRPYILDLPLFLSLPEGFEFRFRYRHRWIANDVLARLSLQRKSLLETPLIIMFHSQESERLLPVRKAKIVDIENHGPFVLLRFAMGAFVSVDPGVIGASNKAQARLQEGQRLSNIGRTLLQLPTHDLSKALPEQHYLVGVDGEPDNLKWCALDGAGSEELSSSWASVAALLMDEVRLGSKPLFHLLGFRQQDGKYVAATTFGGKYTVSKTPVKGFSLVEGRRYRLRLLEWCESASESAPAAQVSVRVPESVLSLEGASDLVVGRYDVLEFSFRAAKPGYGELGVRVEPPDEHDPSSPSSVDPSRGDQTSAIADSANWPVWYTARIPVKVGHNILRVAITGILAVVGVILYLWKNPVEILQWSIPAPGRPGQLVGLVFVMVGLGEYLERFVKHSKEVERLLGAEPPERPR